MAAMKFRTPSAPRPVHQQAYTAASTAAVSTGAATECGSAAGAWYTFSCTESCRVIFGTSTVAAASLTNAMLFPYASIWTLWLSSTEDTHLRVISDGVDGSLSWYRCD